jgi:hypothetical protein
MASVHDCARYCVGNTATHASLNERLRDMIGHCMLHCAVVRTVQAPALNHLAIVVITTCTKVHVSLVCTKTTLYARSNTGRHCGLFGTRDIVQRARARELAALRLRSPCSAICAPPVVWELETRSQPPR